MKNLSDSDDTLILQSILENIPAEINVKSAGSAMRFLTAYLSISEGEYTITGTERMKHRPIGPLVEALRYLGADIQYLGEEGFPPLGIRGKKLKGGSIEMSGNVSSQFISALMLIGPVLPDGIRIKIKDNIVSRPYLDLTMWTMKQFGADVEWSDVDTIEIAPHPYQTAEFYIENDWSAASYWYEILALCDDNESEIWLKGLKDGSKQGDSMVRYIFSLLGVRTTFQADGDAGQGCVRLTKQKSMLPRLEYNFYNSPDIAQTVIVSCAALGIPFRFYGLTNLRVKETDRVMALEKELKKIGVFVDQSVDSELIWDGRKNAISAAPIETYTDHRMAMSFAPVAIKHPGITIDNPDVVTKSYPDFWKDLEKAGFEIIKIND